MYNYQHGGGWVHAHLLQMSGMQMITIDNMWEIGHSCHNSISHSTNLRGTGLMQSRVSGDVSGMDNVLMKAKQNT